MSRSNSISSNSRCSSYTKKQSSARTEIQSLPFGQQMLAIYPEQINSKKSIIDFQKQMQSLHCLYIQIMNIIIVLLLC